MTAAERARIPLAFGPALLAAALFRPAGLIPEAPLALLPRDTWVLLFLAACAPAATILTARAFVKDPAERAHAMTTGGAAFLAAVLATAIGAIALADPLLYRDGGARVVLVASIAALAIVAGALCVKPASRALAGALGGELVVVIALRFLLGAPASPPEMLKRAMVVEPGWGQTSLGSLAMRRLRPARALDLDAWDRAIASAIEQGGLEEWSDDARAVRAWIALRHSRLAPARREELSRLMAAEHGLFAASPASKLEPFTRGGFRSLNAWDPPLDTLEVDDDLRYRIAFAWDALEVFAVVIDDAEREAEAIALVRSLFEQNGLSRVHRLYLATITIERARLLRNGDAEKFAARFEELAKQDWPPELAQEFAGTAKFVRDHPEEGSKPVLLLLRARTAAQNGDLDAALAAYRELVTSWPASPLAPTARLEMARLGKSGS